MYREIYFDNSATTRPFEEVADFMREVTLNSFGNPSSLHRKGIEAEKLVLKARERIAVSLGVETREIIFTSGGTESNNLAIRGYLEANPRKGKRILTTGIEHPSVLEVYKYLSLHGYEIDYINVDKTGIIDLNDLESKIDCNTALISIISVNNEAGTIQPIEDIVKIRNSRNKDAVLHSDAVQGYGKIGLLPKKTGVDMLSLSSHKIHGPKGVGAIYINKSLKIKPVVFGGGQENMLRSGTENVPGICGFGLASEIIFKNINENTCKIKKMKNFFIEQLAGSFDNTRINSPENSSPYILNASFRGVKSEVLLHHLEERNIYVSTGSACSSRKNIHSHVLKAMKLDTADIDGAIRFSFSSFNEMADVEETMLALKEILPKLKKR